jgi:hypothetical protein
MTGYEKAIAAVGNAAELSRRISAASGKTITLQAVLKWREAGIPAGRCAIVEQVTGVPRSQLNDLFGDSTKPRKAA